MPKITKQTFLNESSERKSAILKDRAKARVEREKKAINKTSAAQVGTLEKIYLALYHSIKKDAQLLNENLSLEERFDLEMTNRGPLSEEDTRSSELDKQAIDAIMPELTLEKFRAMYFYVGMINAKAAQDLAREQKKIKQDLLREYDEETSQKMSEALAFEGGCMAHQIDNYAHLLLKDMASQPYPNPTGTGNTDYDSVMQHLLKEDLKTKLVPADHPTMTFAQYMDLVHMPQNEREGYLNQFDASPEDNLYDAYWKKLQTDDLRMRMYNRKSDVEKETAKPAMIFEEIASSYVKYMPKAWHNEGMRAFKKGLPKTEQKEVDYGLKLKESGSQIAEVKQQLKQQGIDYDSRQNKMLHDNTISNYQLAREKVTCGKRLEIRKEYGFSEAIFVDGEKNYIERRNLMKGALLELEAIPTTWKYHGSNSAKYNKMVAALRGFHEATARGDGGAAQEERAKLIKYGLDYVKGKESKRSNPNGQRRFDAVMTLLYEELKPEAFASLIDKINGKRSEADAVTTEYYANRKRRFIKAGVKDAAFSQQKSTEYATKMSIGSIPKIVQMDTYYAPSDELLMDPQASSYTRLPAVGPRGIQGGSGPDNPLPANEYALSIRDFAALSFANALSSSKRDSVLYEDNVLHQNEEATAEGKKAAELALKSYGEGDRVPLARILNIGIKKLNMEAEDKTPGQKECLREMATRLVRMISRDPELEKYVQREGLTQEDMENAKNIGTEKEKIRNDQMERTESLISLD